LAAFANDPATVAFLQACCPPLDEVAWPALVNDAVVQAWIGDFTAQITGASVLNLINETSAWITGTVMPTLTANVGTVPPSPTTPNRGLPAGPAARPGRGALAGHRQQRRRAGLDRRLTAQITGASVLNLINETSAWITGTVMPTLTANVGTVAAIANHANTVAFLQALLPALDEVQLAAIVNNVACRPGSATSPPRSPALPCST